MMNRSLLALAVSAFVIGTTEFIILGLLPDLAHDFSVSIPKAGTLVTAYALSVTLGSPFVSLVVSRWERRRALITLMGMFALGNALCSLAPHYGMLLGARILTALAHGAFFGIGSIVAAGLVRPEQRSRAIALMFTGLTLANVLGVPAGTALGQRFGWRMAFAVLIPLAALAALALLRFVPQQQPERIDLRSEFRSVIRPGVQLVLTISTLSSTAMFCVLTYVTPLLETVAGVSPHGVTLVLVLFGVGMTAGNLIGGRLAGWRQLTSMLGLGAVLILVLIVFSLVATAPLPAAMIVSVWGLVHLAGTVPLQSRVVDGAVGAPNLASVLNQSAFNLGNAIGAWLGGQALLGGLSYAELPLLSAILAGCGLLILALDGFLSRRRRLVLASAM